jgi:hypothetical protein
MVRGFRIDRRWVEDPGVCPLEEGLLRQCFIKSFITTHLDEEISTTAEEDGLMVGGIRAET